MQWFLVATVLCIEKKIPQIRWRAWNEKTVIPENWGWSKSESSVTWKFSLEDIGNVICNVCSAIVRHAHQLAGVSVHAGYATAGDAGSPPGKLCVLLGKTSLCLLLLMIRYLCVQQHAATCICNWIGSSSVQIVPKGCSPFLSSCLYTFRYKRLETRWWMSLVDVRLKLIRRRRRRRRRGGEAVVAVSSSRSRSRDRTAKEQNLE